MNEGIQIAKTLLVIPFEGCAKRLPDGHVAAYPDPGSGGDPWTIGFGTTGPDVTPTTVWTMAECEKRLDAHLRHFAMALIKASPTILSAAPRRFAAVLSWVYNCGLGNYRISTFKRRVGAGDWAGAREECVKWNKARGRVMRGLTRRREAEALMMR